MRCSICGAKLKKDGDICSNCYKIYQEEEDLKKDVKEQLKLKRVYAIAYEFSRYTEIIVIFLLSIIGCMAMENFGAAFITLLLCAVVLGILFFVDKQIARGTKAVFYQKKVVYKFDFLFIHKEKIVKYSDLKGISYFQTGRQKKYGYGDLCVYAKGSIPGTSLFNGFQIKNINDVKGNFEKIKEIVGTLK